jgi:hypothetical protein
MTLQVIGAGVWRLGGPSRQTGDKGPGLGLFGGRDRIFEVEDEGVGPAIFCPRELAFGIAGNEQEGAQSHVNFRERAGRAGTVRAPWPTPTVSKCRPSSNLPIPTGSAFAIDIAPGCAVRFARPCSRDRLR